MYTLFMASSLDLLLFFFLETSLDDVLRRTDLWAEPSADGLDLWAEPSADGLDLWEEPSADGLDLVEFDKENMHLCEKLIRTDTFACNTVSDLKILNQSGLGHAVFFFFVCGLT